MFVTHGGKLVGSSKLGNANPVIQFFLLSAEIQSDAAGKGGKGKGIG